MSLFQSHSETSREAAEVIDEAGELKEVLSAFYQFGAEGANCDQVYKRLPAMYPRWSEKAYGTVSARMVKLKEDGQIFFTNEKRPTGTGTMAEVWRHKDYATDGDRLCTAQKPGSKRQVAIEAMENAVRYLESQVKGNAISGKHWIGANRYNVTELQKAIDLLK